MIRLLRVGRMPRTFSTSALDFEPAVFPQKDQLWSAALRQRGVQRDQRVQWRATSTQAEPTNSGRPACRPHSNRARRPLRRLYRKQLGVAAWIACRYYFFRAGWLSPIGGDGD